MDPKPMPQVLVKRPRRKANDARIQDAPKQEPPPAVDPGLLRVNLKLLRVPALVERLLQLEARIMTYDAVIAAHEECNEEIGKRLHGAGVGKITVGNEERRVRGVNGSRPPRYKLYGIDVKKKKGNRPVVDISKL